MPIQTLKYGAFTQISSIKYILGPLICEGKNGTYPSEESTIQHEMVDARLKSISSNLMNMNSNMEMQFNISDQKIQMMNNEINESSLQTNEIIANFTNVYQEQFTELKSELLTKLADLDKKIIVQSEKTEVQREEIVTWLNRMSLELEDFINRSVIAFRVSATSAKGSPGKILIQMSFC